MEGSALPKAVLLPGIRDAAPISCVSDAVSFAGLPLRAIHSSSFVEAAAARSESRIIRVAEGVWAAAKGKMS